MNKLTNFKSFTSGCVFGLLGQIYMFSIAEKRFQNRKNELNRLKLLYQNEIENIGSKYLIKKYQDLVISILFHSYLEYFIGLGFRFAKILNSEDKEEKMKKFINDILESETTADEKI